MPVGGGSRRRPVLVNYYVRMSSGDIHHIPAPSAAEAQQRSLEASLGATILSCWCGSSSRSLDEGFTDFEVPAHAALTAKPKRPRRPKDNSMPMFSEREIPRSTKTRQDSFHD